MGRPGTIVDAGYTTDDRIEADAPATQAPVGRRRKAAAPQKANALHWLLGAEVQGRLRAPGDCLN